MLNLSNQASSIYQDDFSRSKLGASQKWVVKIGSAMITNHGAGIDEKAINAWATDIAKLLQQGKEVVLVSSGAVAAGMQKLGLQARPAELSKVQAAAAVGQMSLLKAYETAFAPFGIQTAQVLITHEDCADRKRYLNIRTTLRALLDYGVVPIVNENDAVTYDEIRFGDNDSIGALMANLIDASLYVILTDQQGMFNDNPSVNPAAELISVADADDKSLINMASEGGALGRGGMVTKVNAAQLAARSGTATVIATGADMGIISKIANGETVGTVLLPPKVKQGARKQWLMSQLQVSGKLVVDSGAENALCQQGKSLLPVGVKAVQGDFQRGELVSVVNSSDMQIAKGLINYSSVDANRILGMTSDGISEVLGYRHADEIVHRDNLVVM
jgi:glutamate 5-kinase